MGQKDNPVEQNCSCSGGDCGGVSRRDFLRVGAAASAAMVAGVDCCADETSASAAGKVRVSAHLIPAEKNLPVGWLRSLVEIGERAVWKGEELKTIGMPVGGIGTGQLYLCGDGTLGQWDIFNEFEFIGWGARSYARRAIRKPVPHGNQR